MRFAADPANNYIDDANLFSVRASEIIIFNNRIARCTLMREELPTNGC